MKPCRMCGRETFGEVCSTGCGRRLAASHALVLAQRLDDLGLADWAAPLREVVDDVLDRGDEPVAWCGVARLLERLTRSLE